MPTVEEVWGMFCNLDPSVRNRFIVYYANNEHKVEVAFNSLARLPNPTAEDVKQVVEGLLRGGTDSPPYLLRDLVKRLRSTWSVLPGNDSTVPRALPNIQLERWDLREEKVQIMEYVEQMCGDLEWQEQLYPGVTHFLDSENSCNVEFVKTYGEVAAKIVSIILNIELTCHLNPASAAILGLPDIVFKLRRGSKTVEVLVMEGKSPSVMRSTPTIFLDLEVQCAGQIKKCVEQEADYMFRREFKYGGLTHLNGTMFFKRTGDLNFAITDALKPEVGDPAKLEMLVYVLLKQLEEGSWTLTDEGLKEKVRKLKKADQASEEKAQRQQQQQQREQQSIQPTGSSSTPSTGRRPGLRNRSYTEHRQRDIAVFDECLGYGRSGIVLVGSVYGDEVAFKSADVFKQAELVKQMEHEVSVLDHLSQLQGSAVPQLKHYGFVEEMDVFFVGTSIVPGEHPCSSTRAALPAAEEALAAIHGMGVLHGDVRAENVLVFLQEGKWKACFLDLGLSTFSKDKSQLAAEMWELRLLFRSSDDDSMTGKLSSADGAIKPVFNKMAVTGKLEMPPELLATLTALETTVTSPYSPRSGASSPHLTRSRTASPEVGSTGGAPSSGRRFVASCDINPPPGMLPAAAIQLQRKQEAALQRVLEEEILKEMSRGNALQQVPDPEERRQLMRQLAAEREAAKARILEVGNQLLTLSKPGPSGGGAAAATGSADSPSVALA